jgi:hypothetical protein
LSVSELYVQLRLRSGDWQLERFDAEPGCWRRFSGPGGRSLVLKPDAYLIGTSGAYEDRYFIEIDRATESRTRITDKALNYVRYWQSGREQTAHGIFPRVLWSVPDDVRAQQLIDALGELPAEHWQLFTVAIEAEAARTISGPMPSTTKGGEA